MIPNNQQWRPESEAFDYPLTAGWNPRIFIQALTWRFLDVHLEILTNVLSLRLLATCNLASVLWLKETHLTRNLG